MSAYGARGGLLALALALALAGCSGNSAPLTGGDNSLNLAQVPWCDQPNISFQDDSTTAQNVVSNWSTVKDQLGFTPYLPATLPKGSCLALAGGSIHDPIFGGKMSITYVLPQSVALAFSEAPKRATGPTDLQCVSSTIPGTKNETTSVCQGIIDSTSITIASKQPTSALQDLFHALQPNVLWVPTSNPSTPQGTSTPTTPTTPTATATTNG
jgi:hypothetical protein